jgi:hypothetical protein
MFVGGEELRIRLSKWAAGHQEWRDVRLQLSAISLRPLI